MGAQPKRKLSRGRRDRRRSQDGLSAPSLATCPKCGKARRPHFQCKYCGYYGDKPAVKESSKSASKTAKQSTPKKK